MDEHKNLLINENASIKEGWKQLDLNGHKILFVTDEGGIIIGSVTDGDIRRWILSDKSISQSISLVMNKKPLSAKEADPISSIKELMLNRRVECIPVLDASKKPVRFLFWDFVFNEKKPSTFEPIDVPVVIMAGGRGVRLDPFTKILPKPLIPIGEKPIIEMIIDRFSRHEVKQFYISVNYRSNMIRAYFQDNINKNNLHFFEEKTPLGTAGALHLLKDKIKSSFMVSNCDILIEADYADILKFHRKNKNSITLVCSLRHFSIPYGVVEIENGGRLKEIREKPEFDYLVNSGFYVMEPELLEQIPENRLYHVTHLIDKLKKEGAKIGVYPIGNGAWIDIGELEEYKKNLKLFE